MFENHLLNIVCEYGVDLKMYCLFKLGQVRLAFHFWHIVSLVVRCRGFSVGKEYLSNWTQEIGGTIKVGVKEILIYIDIGYVSVGKGTWDSVNIHKGSAKDTTC